MTGLDYEIAACSKCPSRLITNHWMPISYFGEMDRANAWTISINPSAREFTDAAGNELIGNNQRFSIVSDFPDCPSRTDVAAKHLETVLSMQQTVLRRAPYKNYFARLGRFLARVAGVDADDPMTPFTTGIEWGSSLRLFCHLDIVKCSTRHPWSNLDGGDRSLLIGNCAPYLQQQIQQASSLRLILINGRTAFDTCAPLLTALGLEPIQRRVALDTTSASIYSGPLPREGAAVQIIAWTANVVNGHLTKGDMTALARAVRKTQVDSG